MNFKDILAQLLMPKDKINNHPARNKVMRDAEIERINYQAMVPPFQGGGYGR